MRRAEHDTSARRLPPLYHPPHARRAKQKETLRNPLRIGVRSSRRSVSELCASAAGPRLGDEPTDRPQSPINTPHGLSAPVPPPLFPPTDSRQAVVFRRRRRRRRRRVLSELALGCPCSALPRRRTTYAGLKQGTHAPLLSSVVV